MNIILVVLDKLVHIKTMQVFFFFFKIFTILVKNNAIYDTYQKCPHKEREKKKDSLLSPSPS